jgi:hypothetical protein
MALPSESLVAFLWMWPSFPLDTYKYLTSITI